jgi:hypothetical protein
MPRLSNTVTLRTLLGVALLVFVLSAGAGAATSALVIEQGPRGRPGPTGPEGPRGRPGRADAKSVLEAIQRQPARVAAAVQNHLDPSLGEFDSRVDTLESDLTIICQSFALSEPCKTR